MKALKWPFIDCAQNSSLPPHEPVCALVTGVASKIHESVFLASIRMPPKEAYLGNMIRIAHFQPRKRFVKADCM